MRDFFLSIAAMGVVILGLYGYYLGEKAAYYERAFVEISSDLEINYGLHEGTMAKLRECRGEAPVKPDFNKGKIRR